MFLGFHPNLGSPAFRLVAFSQVIQAMTVGSDVSSLFPDVVNCMQTNSLDLKLLGLRTSIPQAQGSGFWEHQTLEPFFII